MKLRVTTTTTKRRVREFTFEEIEALLIKAADLPGVDQEVEWTGSCPFGGASVLSIEQTIETEGDC